MHWSITEQSPYTVLLICRPISAHEAWRFIDFAHQRLSPTVEPDERGMQFLGARVSMDHGWYDARTKTLSLTLTSGTEAEAVATARTLIQHWNVRKQHRRL